MFPAQISAFSTARSPDASPSTGPAAPARPQSGGTWRGESETPTRASRAGSKTRLEVGADGHPNPSTRCELGPAKGLEVRSLLLASHIRIFWRGSWNGRPRHEFCCCGESPFLSHSNLLGPASLQLLWPRFGGAFLSERSLRSHPVREGLAVPRRLCNAALALGGRQLAHEFEISWDCEIG
jgi:hypothetical protein